MSINHAALDAAFESYDPKKPISMIFLAKFRETADYAPYLNENVSVDSSPCSGREAMARYRAGTKPLIPAGAQMLFYGTGVATMIAPAGETWDEVVLVKYEDLAGFRKTVQSEVYKREVEVHRLAATEDSRLILVEQVET